MTYEDILIRALPGHSAKRSLFGANIATASNDIAWCTRRRHSWQLLTICEAETGIQKHPRLLTQPKLTSVTTNKKQKLIVVVLIRKIVWGFFALFLVGFVRLFF